MMRATTPPLNLNIRRPEYLPSVLSRGASTHTNPQPLQQLQVEGQIQPAMSWAPQPRVTAPQLVVEGVVAGQRAAIVGPSRNYSLPPQGTNYAQLAPATVPLQMPQQYNNGGKQDFSYAPGGLQQWESDPPGHRPQQEFIGSTINQWTTKMQQDAVAMAQLDQEEAMAAAEEASLRAKMAELEERRQQLDKELFAVNQGWSTLYEMEERYYTEPVADRSQEIAEGEYRCAVLQERFNEAQLQLDMTARQLEAFAYIADRKNEQAALLDRLARGFEQVERRRAAAVARAEHLFEVETQRERKCSAFVLALDSEIRTITVTAGLSASSSGQAVESRQQPQRPRIVSFDKTPETVLVPTQSNNMTGLDCESVCYGIGDDDGLADASVMYSVCNLKKPRTEAPALVR